ncbi:MAG: hypothetical protein HOP05_18635 [Ferruginibacter sp.]|nr:hypothetical protein [Ferruginibacter sp.]
MAKKIQSKLKVEDAGALAIGINGSWGSGKTSFTNMIKEQIDNNNRVIINFNPWRSSSANKIIEDFFELFISELKPHDPELSSSITSYAKSLTKIEENLITKAVESLSEILFEELNKNESYDLINDSIKRLKNKLSFLLMI